MKNFPTVLKPPVLPLIFLTFLFISIPASAQFDERPWWYNLEEGKLLFRNGAYGDALIAFENARRGRLAQFTRIEQDFIRLLSVPDVRRLGDSLDFIEQYIAVRGETASAAALAYLFHHVSRESLGGSANRALEALDRLKSFPEAEFWLGETYRAEGELSLALRQYETAWNERALLQAPGFEVEILYRITDIHRIRQEYQEMERRANEIITGLGPSGVPRDELWNQTALRAAMARLLDTEGVHRFLSLYRHNNTVTERAHRLLGFFYQATNRHIPAAEHLMFAFLIQNTVLIDDIIRRQPGFIFTTLDDLTGRAFSRTDLAEFMEETEYYRTVFFLSSALHATGRTVPAMQLWAFLAGSARAGVWGERARRNPVPYIEPAIELP